MRVLERARAPRRRAVSVTSSVVGVDDLAPALDVLHLAQLRELAGAARQPLDDVVLERAQLVEVDRRLAELDAPGRRVARLRRRASRRAAAPSTECSRGRRRRRRDSTSRIDQRDAAARDRRRETRPHSRRGRRRDEVDGSRHGTSRQYARRRRQFGSAQRAQLRFSLAFCDYPWSASRNGCSSASTTQRRKRMPSAPSIDAVVVRQRQRQHQRAARTGRRRVTDRLHARARHAEDRDFRRR